MVAVGIDLGTTCCCVAVWKHGAVEVIPNENGCRTTPSVISFTHTRLIGDAGKSSLDIKNTVYGAKKFIGRKYGDLKSIDKYPFLITNDENKIKICVDYKGEKKLFSPEQLYGMLICRMKEISQDYLGVKIDKAVITVPAYYNDAQRQATKTAGVLAGLEVLKVINEPTATALAYGMCTKLNNNSKILIFDLGGGHFDVSVIHIRENNDFQVKSTVGQTNLGGDDFDDRLVSFFVQDIKKRFKVDVSSDFKALRRLKTAAESAKRLLTSSNQTSIHIDCVEYNIQYNRIISRRFFESLCSDLFTKTISLVDKALLDAGLSKNDIDDVILVGGSTRIPKIQSLLKGKFKKITTSINPDEAVACGAAIQAAILSGNRDNKIKGLKLVDVIPLSLGVETARGMMYKIIERNTPIPCQITKDLTTLEDYQNAMTIEIFEGERALTKDNNLLGSFDLKCIPPAPRGVAKIDVTFKVNVDGILSVSARDRSTGNIESVTINNQIRLSQSEVTKMLAEAEFFQEEDKENKLRLQSRNQLESYVFEVKRSIFEDEVKLSDEERVLMVNELEEAMKWIDENTDCLREEYERKLTELMRKWSGFMRKMYSQDYKPTVKRQRSENYQPELSEIETVNIEEIHDI
ncbi:hypothetical protein K1T71_000664 [Dendrolimus kikuchii]|uniref:Uncharacterized protein n=1 Tax=Dendrolimus kikuchii TaxID=765133 RepID=A0ACC1DK15_9NEOP|nr:hypothetical protein K1T71_000664 [Dendrolimus kikuchii]